MAKKAAPVGLVQCNVRMPIAALEYLDGWVEDLNGEAGWEKFTRSDVIRDLVLEAIEKRKGQESKPKK